MDVATFEVRRGKAVNAAWAPHPLYFLTRTEGLCRATFATIEDERTSERFACVFVSARDAEGFAVANGLAFDTWKISEAQSADSIHNRCAVALRDGAYKAVINPPPVIRGAWRTLRIEFLRT
jgi:hypothetical protein